MNENEGTYTLQPGTINQHPHYAKWVFYSMKCLKIKIIDLEYQAGISIPTLSFHYIKLPFENKHKAKLSINWRKQIKKHSGIA